MITNNTMMTDRPAASLRQILRRRATRFGRDESGAMIIFGLMIFVLMLLIGGIAVDVMRFETTRSELQATADRCSLAAASLNQTMDPTTVVRDCFKKAGHLDKLSGVTVAQGFNYRSVSADVTAASPSLFMQMVGVETLAAPADSTAEERISDIEISLVLDVSGSMNDNSKLPNLKIAAKNFVDTVLANDGEQKISISIVPFNGQVNLGATLVSRYVLSTQHTLNTCVDFATSDFASTSISPTATLTRSDVLDPWDTSWNTAVASGKAQINGHDQNYCTTDTRTVVRPYLRDITTIKAAIDGLVAEGNTSIDVGVKWGLAMLDPGTRPVITSMITSAAVPAVFAGRPFAFNREDTAKIIVVMSDGENTDQFQVKAPYKTGASPIYRRSSDGSLVIYNASVGGSNKYYVLDKTKFTGSYTGAMLGSWQATLPTGYTNLTWPQVFNQHPLQWVARYLYGNALGTGSSSRQTITNTWLANFMTTTEPSTKDTQMDTVCDLAKSSAVGARVFTVAFEAPSAGQAALLNCASSTGDYYAVAGSALTIAFQSIARQISQLRLTQ